MRALVLFLGGVIVMALGFWSYQENYKTRDAIAEVRDLHREIGAAHERLGVLRAEWAYLNRPDQPLPEILPITDPIDVREYMSTQTDENPL